MKKKNIKFEQLEFTSKKNEFINNFNFIYKLDIKVILSFIIILFLLIIIGISMFKIYSIVNNTNYEKEDGIINYSVCGNDNKCSTNININKVDNINKIKLFYSYNYKSSIYKKFNMNYWIDASILIENESKELYGTTKKIIKNMKSSFVSKKVNINEDIIVYLNDYYKIIDNYKKDHNINNCTSNISFILYINNNGIISKISSLDLTIDDSSNVFISSNNLYNDALKNDVNNNNYILLLSLISIISIILCILLIIKITIYILNKIDYYRKYNKRIHKIISKYKKDIIIGNNYSDDDNYVNVSSFLKLIDYKKKYNSKIKIYNINNKCIFIVKGNNKLYRFVME